MKYKQLSGDVQRYLINEFKDMIENEADRQNIVVYDDPTDEIVNLLHELDDDYDMDGVVPQIVTNKDNEKAFTIEFKSNKVSLSVN